MLKKRFFFLVTSLFTLGSLPGYGAFFSSASIHLSNGMEFLIYINKTHFNSNDEIEILYQIKNLSKANFLVIFDKEPFFDNYNNEINFCSSIIPDLSRNYQLRCVKLSPNQSISGSFKLKTRDLKEVENCKVSATFGFLAKNCPFSFAPTTEIEKINLYNFLQANIIFASVGKLDFFIKPNIANRLARQAIFSRKIHSDGFYPS